MNRFVDIEATVDVETDDSEEERDTVERDLEETYDDDSDSNVTKEWLATTNARGIHDGEDEEQGFEDFLDGLLDKITRMEGVSTSPMQYATRPHESVIAVQPGSDEYPLWRVACRIGMEDVAVMAIYRMASGDHAIRSAFTRGSVRGYIYVECKTPSTLQPLLRNVPGIKLIQGGINTKWIHPKDHIKLLTMKNLSTDVETHSWARIRGGLYKGDEGLVISVHDWGVAVLLVPRIGQVEESRKRKATTVRPIPRLMQDESPHVTTTIHTRSVAGESERVIRTEHGLILKAFGFTSVIRNASDMPFHLFQEFRRSGHPVFEHVRLIRPREWQVIANDAIYNTATGEDGVVETVQTEGVKATMSTGLLAFVPWKLLQKRMQSGAQVTVAAGARTGMSGWVVAVRGDVATVATHKHDGKIKGNEEDIEHFEVYVNYLITGTSQLDVTTEETEINNSSRHDPVKCPNHPWIGIEVVVKDQQAIKGRIGVVEDVIPPSATNGPPRIIMRTISYDPNIPYKIITVDSDIVVTRKLHHPLLGVNNTNSSSYQFESVNDETVRSRTPEAEEEEYSSTPTWNPSAPDLTLESIGPGVASRSATVAHHIAHPFAHPALVGATVKTYVNENANSGSSKAKETTIYIDRSNGSCALRTKKYHEWRPVSLDSVTPKHPSPTHDNGLILVIKGEHTGMYGRRLGHVRRNGVAYMILELVTIKEGKADTLTGTIIELAAEDMCVVDESASQKKLNTDLMKISRQNYQKETRNRF